MDFFGGQPPGSQVMRRVLEWNKLDRSSDLNTARGYGNGIRNSNSAALNVGGFINPPAISHMKC